MQIFTDIIVHIIMQKFNNWYEWAANLLIFTVKEAAKQLYNTEVSFSNNYVLLVFQKMIC